MPRPVLDAARDYLTLEAEIGGYEAAEREDAAIERFYGAAAELLGCDTDEIAFVENATRAWDMAFYALPLPPATASSPPAPSTPAMSSRFCRSRSARGQVEVIPSDETGRSPSRRCRG